MADRSAIEQIRVEVVRHLNHPRRHDRPGQPQSPSFPQLWDFDDHEDVLLCMTAVGPSGPARLGTSLSTAASVPMGPGPLGQVPSAIELGPVVRFGRAELDQVRNLHEHFLSRNETQKAALRVPLRRLNLALRRRWDVDSALDLGVALEVLFSDRRPFDSSIGFAIRLRAARLLRKSKAERMELAELAKNLYKVRSGAAHSGELPKSVGGTPVAELLRRGAELVAEATRYMIAHGAPDWNDVEFG